MNILIASFVSILATAFWIATLLGLPGNWGLVLLGGLIVYFVPESMHVAIGIPVLVTIVLAALIGELLEFLAGAAGVNQMGGSKRGAALALTGSVAGAIVGMFVGVPIPIIGSLIAALLFGGLGALGGAVAGERWAGKDWEQSFQIGWGALWGKLLGTLLKTICGSAMLVLLLLAIWT